MHNFWKILFLFAFAWAVGNGLRLSYQIWFEPTQFSLDRYDDETQQLAKNATSLKALQESYDQVHAEIQAFEKANPSESEDPQIKEKRRELNQKESRLRQAINAWEIQSEAILKLRLFFAAGVLLCVLGWLSYRFGSKWLGFSCFFVGFLELFYWSSPSFFGGRTAEYERMLHNKFFLGLVALGLLIGAARTVGLLANPVKEPEPTPASPSPE
ncbi:MAG: hypothetical protein H6510_02210 [Acidobacteria bacterium]|nr:hypothetical protein [Acidobacteriota bacterium]MCB9396607.1 hypothetical protein [Acidobacteriota bacterium]